VDARCRRFRPAPLSARVATTPLGDPPLGNRALGRQWKSSGEPGSSTGGAEQIHGDDAMRILHAGPRPKDHAGDHGDQRRVQADDRREYQHHDGGEARLPAEVPQGVRGILPEAFEPWPDPHAARSFPRERRVADRTPGRLFRVHARHDVPLQFLLRHRAMKLDLLGEIALELPLSDDVPHTTKLISHADL
jgi:hypothetical protein